MKPPVAIIFANAKGNLGDFAILHSILVDLELKRHGHPVHVYSQPFVSIDDARLAAFRKLAPEFELVGTTFADGGNVHKMFIRIARALGLRRQYQAARIWFLAKRANAPAKHFSQYQEVYVAGGAQWTGVDSGVSMFATLRAIAAHAGGIYSYPFSVSPSLWKVNTMSGLASDFAKIAAPLIARDSSSAGILTKLSLETKLGADCVFSLAETGRSVAAAIRTEKTRVLFVVTSQKSEAIGDTLRRLQAGTFSIDFLTTCETEDRPIQGPVASAHGSQLISPLTWQEAVSEMKASDVVITNRLHGLILASFAGVPVLPLTDRSKVLAVVEDANLPLQIPSLSSLTSEIIRECIDRRTEIVGKIAEYQVQALAKRRSPIMDENA